MAAAVVETTGNNTGHVPVISHDHVFKQTQIILPKCMASQEIEPFIHIFEGKVSETGKMSVETAVRYFVMHRLYQGNNTDLGKITSVASLSISLTRKEICLPTLPMLVLSDAFDSLTVQQCERLFSFVEGNVSVWKEPLFFAPSKNQVLRMCNDVLRRLSRSQNTIFCGRILLFLARFFPFSERSGLNLISEFNLENVTTYSTTETEENMEVVEVKDDDDDIKEISLKDDNQASPKLSLDSTLYTKFWSLQDFFRNPIQCYQREPWRLFTSYTSDVLEAFSSFKLENQSKSPAGADDIFANYSDMVMEAQSDLDKTIVDTMPDVKKVDQYFAKFLTNQRLLDLQFSDSNFRRYVLMQLLILFHYLTAAIKFKQENLGPAETEWVKATEQKVFGLIKETPPDGEKFVVIVKKILQREDQWNEWKNSGCPEVKKPATATTTTPPTAQNGNAEEDECKKRGTKRKLGDIIREAESKKKFVMANAEMTRLWNICGDNSEATRLSKRDFTPSLEQYFKRAVEQVMSGEQLSNAQKIVCDSDFGWRALRILACRSPHFFTHSTAPIATLPEYLTTMIKKLAKDMPAVNGRPREPQDQSNRGDHNTQSTVPKQEEASEKVIPEEGEEQMEEEEDNNTNEEEEIEREELKPITSEEQTAIAKNVAAVATAPEQWRKLTKMLNFEDDEVDYILDQKQGNVQACLEHFLQLWVENEGEEGNKDCILYILGGAKLAAAGEGVFN